MERNTHSVFHVPSKSIPIPSHHRRSVRHHYCHSHSFRAWCENPFVDIFPPLSHARHTVNQHIPTARNQCHRHEIHLSSRLSVCTKSTSVQILGFKTPTPSLHITRRRPFSGRERARDLRAVAWCQNTAVTSCCASGAPSIRFELSHSSSTYEESAHAYSISLNILRSFVERQDSPGIDGVFD